MDKNQPVHIVGAGFSGLSAAYYLTKAGYKVEVFEKTERAGGIVRTTITEHGLAESAANAFLNSTLLEAMAKEIGVEMLRPLPSSKARYLFRFGKATRWPLSFRETLKLVSAFFRFLFAKATLIPDPNETVATWADAHLGIAARKQLLTPALQGIYAGDVHKLSALLILGNLFKKTRSLQKPSFSGSTAPRMGMSEFANKLVIHLQSLGVVFHFQFPYQLETISAQKIILCCAPKDAAQIVQGKFPTLAKQLNCVELLSVISVAIFYPPEAKSIHGFGCLFPRDEGIRSLGVLSSSEIFAGRGVHTETWILGGAEDAQLIQKSDEELIQIIRLDREKLLHENVSPLAYKIHRWDQTIPHYTTQLEQLIPSLELPENIFLFGNYLGKLGLTKIIEAASKLPEEIFHG